MLHRRCYSKSDRVLEYGYHRWESVKMIIDGLGRVDVIHLIQLRNIAFYRRIFTNLENSVLCRLFCVF